MSAQTLPNPTKVQPPSITRPAITPEFIDDYIKNRVDQYAGWYDKKCGPVKQRHLYIKAISVIGGAVVPVLVNLTWEFAPMAATFVSLLVVILVSWDSVYQYGKQWKNYRSTEQFLRQETIFFQHRVGFYSDMDDNRAFRIYVERVETAIAQENAVTLDTLTRESNTGKAGTKEG